MTERRTNDIPDNQPLPEIALGRTFITRIEAKFLKLRSKYRDTNISTTIQELILPVIEAFEKANDYERENQLRGYAEQVFSKSTIANASKDNNPPPYVWINCVLPKTFIDRLNHVANQVWCAPQSLLSCILSNAIEMKNNS